MTTTTDTTTAATTVTALDDLQRSLLLALSLPVPTTYYCGSKWLRGPLGVPFHGFVVFTCCSLFVDVDFRLSAGLAFRRWGCRELRSLILVVQLPGHHTYHVAVPWRAKYVYLQPQTRKSE